MDKAILLLFVVLLGMCTAMAVGSQTAPHLERWYIHFTPEGSFPYHGSVLGALFNIASYLVLFNQFIPLSLYVTLEVVKICQAQYMAWDRNMYDERKDTAALASNSNLTEELGQIEYIFSDKTGTLTQNEMRFQALALADRAYDFSLDKKADDEDDAESSSSSSSGGSSRSTDANGVEVLNGAQMRSDMLKQDDLSAQLHSFWLALALW